MRTMIIMLLSLFLVGASPALEPPVKIHTMTMKPYVYEPMARDTGTLLSITKMAFQLANVPYEVEWETSWDDAVDEVNLRANTVLVGDITDRKKDFIYKTTNTYIPINTVMYINTSNQPLALQGVSNLHGLRVGVIADRFTGNEEFDRAYLLDNKTYRKYLDADHLLTALMMGSLDVAVLPREMAEYRLIRNRTLSQYQHKIVEAGVVSKRYLHILWNKRTPDATVEAVEEGFKFARKYIDLHGLSFAQHELERLEN